MTETLCKFCLLADGHTGPHVPQRPAPNWRVVPSPYPGSPAYAIVNESGQVAQDSLDGSVCVFTTRATAEYQLSYLTPLNRLTSA